MAVKVIDGYPVIPANAFAFPKVYADLSALDMDKEEDVQKWLVMRKKGIGGSDIGTIFGVNKWSSLTDLYFQKTSDLPGKEETEAMELGKEMEPVVGKMFTKRTGKQIVRAPYLFQHPVHEWWLGNIDFYVPEDNAGLECKNISGFKKDEWEDDIPDMYYLQCQHYMGALGLNRWYIAVILGGNQFLYRTIDRNDEVIAEIEKRGAQFWNDFVVPRVPPAFDGSDACASLLKMMYPSETAGANCILPDEVDEWWEERDGIKSQIKELESQAKAIDNRIKGLIGDNEFGLTPNGIYKHTTVSRGAYSVEATSYRQLRFSKRKSG